MSTEKIERNGIERKQKAENSMVSSVPAESKEHYL